MCFVCAHSAGALTASGVDIPDVVKKVGTATLEHEDQLVMETKLKIIEILQVRFPLCQVVTRETKVEL